MFDRECERAMFLQDPSQYTLEELGFSRHIHVRDKITKIEDQKPTDFVLYHDLREMWRRRQVGNQGENWSILGQVYILMHKRFANRSM